ncbi:hypothetical protein NG821_00190 [Prevotella cerevisiae]|uniref:Uncharacterized protein n=1 Tax=Segatella cerevisiae TaxID=2053716 RepID=A0ABT1BT75_9BACT|nr:hypothetical protein [Segatella cerevisiae]MCO6024279.1 hypothetical protein [Segatella cerevisiae]
MKQLKMMCIKGFGNNGIKYVFQLHKIGFSWKTLSSEHCHTPTLPKSKLIWETSYGEYCLCSVVLADFSENGIWDDLKTYLESVKSFPNVRSILIDVTPGEQSPHLINHFFSCLYIDETDKFQTVRDFIKLYADAVDRNGMLCMDINDFFLVVRGRKILSVDMFPFENMLNEAIEKASCFYIPENEYGIIYFQTSKKEESIVKEEFNAFASFMKKSSPRAEIKLNYSYREDHYLCILQTTPI